MDESETYLPWAQAIRDGYSRREAAMFILHNNIADIFPLGGEYVPCRRYLERMLERGEYIIINYDVSRGMRFYKDEEARAFMELANQNRRPSEQLIRSIYDFPRESTKALAFVEAFVVGVESAKRPVAVILEYAEHLAPNGDPQTMAETDRINTVTLERFAQLFHERLHDESARDAVCFLLTQNLHNIHPDLVRSELVGAIELHRPSYDERLRFVRWQQAKLLVEGREAVKMELGEAELAEQTAGLTLTGIRHLFLRAMQSPDRRLCGSFVMERKRELIERDSRGMLEIMAPKHGLDAVGGNDAIKDFFRAAARDLREGQRDVPVGVICPGPNGVGKTFIGTAFARDSGVNCVSLRNFRGMYVGQTESNLDTIFNILKAMTPNIVIVDEADKMLGNEQSDPGNKVDERVFGAFTAFMGDPEYRGKIFWLLLTARPYDLAPDTGRPGRVEEHVPILAPETLDDKKSVLAAVARAAGIELAAAGGEPGSSPTDAELASLFDGLGVVTPAALELIAKRARRIARRDLGERAPKQGAIPVRFGLFAQEAASYVPEGSKSKLLLQTVEAVLYTNHLAYLPEPWRSQLRDAPDELSRERERLRRLVGYG
ncbi:MAG: ATP-binding protein [Deltaproteobacteria bacterium]|nr:ATP-binding protein [Deltaproteobacteria bacterium]